MTKCKFDTDKTTLTFNFDSVEAANLFKRWLCGSGEQDYWTWEEENESRQLDIVDNIDYKSSQFSYWSDDPSVIKVSKTRVEK